MKVRNFYNLIPFSLIVGAGVFLLGLSLMGLWALAMPGVIPSPLVQGPFTESLSQFEATKLALAVAALAGLLASRSGRATQRAGVQA